MLKGSRIHLALAALEDKNQSIIAGYPEIMGAARLFRAFVGGEVAALAGYVRDTVGSYLPAFCLAIAVVIIGLNFLICATPPLYPRFWRKLRRRSLHSDPYVAFDAGNVIRAAAHVCLV